MFYRMHFLAAFVLVTIGPAFSAYAHEPTAHATLGDETIAVSARPAAAVVDTFHEALRRGDGKAAAALLADDVLIFETGGAERSKVEYLAQHLAADIGFEQAVPSTTSRKKGGARGNMAWIATEGRTTGSYHGKTIDRVTTETMILHRVGVTWKIVHVHWSSAAAQVR